MNKELLFFLFLRFFFQSIFQLFLVFSSLFLQLMQGFTKMPDVFSGALDEFTESFGHNGVASRRFFCSSASLSFRLLGVKAAHLPVPKKTKPPSAYLIMVFPFSLSSVTPPAM